MGVWSGFGSLVGLGSQALLGSDLVLNKAIERLLSATITLSKQAEDPISIVFIKWYQSLKLETLKKEKERVDGKLAGLLKASKDLDNLIESQRPSPTVESTSGDDQNINSSASENGELTDSILFKPVVKFVKAAERSTTNKVETVKKHSVRYVKL
nr:hypothetical protein [Tanacetum cinerariifolium]